MLYFCIGKTDKKMINRKIDKYLDSFHKTNSKALLITGARQTGKSFSIRHFGATHFESFIEINFVDMPEAIKVVSEAKSSKDILLRLSALTNQPLIERKTLVFLDEVQECPEIVTAIKFLVE